MAILVTGGAGFIGSHTVVELLAAGKEVVIVDNFVNAKPEVLNRIRKISGKDFKFYEADILDRPALDRIFEENDIDSVIHFAALKAVGESCRQPLRYYRNNIAGTLSLCEAMTAHNVKKIVFSSSATVYGMNNPVPFVETMPISQATNPYGSTKVMMETVLTDLFKADPAWSVVLLRYFNPIGAHPSGLIGEDPNGIPNNLLPYVAQVASGKLPYLSVYGDDYDTPDGTGVRDYIHVVDLAKGHLLALDKLAEAGVNIYNLGTCKGYSVLDVVNAFKKASGRDVPYKVVPRRPGDIAVCYADSSKAKHELGWEAKFDLDDMCRDSWNFTKNNPNGL